MPVQEVRDCKFVAVNVVSPALRRASSKHGVGLDAGKTVPQILPEAFGRYSPQDDVLIWEFPTIGDPNTVP